MRSDCLVTGHPQPTRQRNRSPRRILGRNVERVVLVSSVFPNPEQPQFGTFVAERARAYARRAEVLVVAPVPWFPRSVTHTALGRWSAAARIPPETRLDGIRVLHPRRVVIPKIGGPGAGPLYALTLRRTLERVRRSFPFDVIDTHFAWPDGYAAVVAAAGCAPVCVTAQGTDLNLMPRHPVVRPMIAQTLRRASRVVAVCRSLGDQCLRLGCSARKLSIVPPGVDPVRFPLIDVLSARREVGLPADARVLVSVGALIPRKGQRTLLEALARLTKRCVPDHRDLMLVLVGAGPDEQRLRERARRLAIADRVRFVGSVPHDRVALWMNAADVFCLASRREGWPTVLLEAQACGLPIVATRVDGCPEALASDDAGTLVAANDPEDVANGIAATLRRPWDRRLLRARALRRTWESVAADTFEVFESVVGGVRVPS